MAGAPNCYLVTLVGQLSGFTNLCSTDQEVDPILSKVSEMLLSGGTVKDAANDFQPHVSEERGTVTARWVYIS